MKLFRHHCLDGKIYSYHTFGDDHPKECPNKEGCGEDWIEIDMGTFEAKPRAEGEK